jgi:hypothetical protein
MRTTAARQTRENRTITVNFQNEATYFHLLGDGKAFVELVIAFVMSLGFQLKHKTTCCGGGCLTRHSHYMRVRLGGMTIWRLQCTTCRAVFTILPHFILRYRQMRPEVARDALLATHGGLSLELCAILYPISPMALYRLICALGQQSLVIALTRCGLPLPTIFWPMRSTAAVSLTKCTCPRLSLVGSSGTWAIRRRRVQQPLPSHMRYSNARQSPRSRPIASAAF